MLTGWAVVTSVVVDVEELEADEVDLLLLESLVAASCVALLLGVACAVCVAVAAPVLVELVEGALVVGLLSLPESFAAADDAVGLGEVCGAGAAEELGVTTGAEADAGAAASVCDVDARSEDSGAGADGDESVGTGVASVVTAAAGCWTGAGAGTGAAAVWAMSVWVRVAGGTAVRAAACGAPWPAVVGGVFCGTGRLPTEANAVWDAGAGAGTAGAAGAEWL